MPLPLYGSGGRKLADVGGGLAERHAVDARQDELAVLVDLGLDARRQLVDDRVREAERELEGLCP